MTGRQLRMIEALLACDTQREAAERANVPLRTLTDWLRNAEFLDEYRRARQVAYETVMAHLQQSCGRALACLQRNLACGTPGAEINAAKAILETAKGAIETFDLDSRLRAIEERLAKTPRVVPRTRTA
jgi:hypothetical protein